MKEIKDIIRAYDEAQHLELQTALATVVQVEGSSYRRPGARMLIREDGRLTGAISGGCLEGDALRKALLVMSRSEPMLVTYNTMDDDDAKLGIGLGCNGIIHILIEPVVASNKNNPIELLRKITARRQEAILVTMYSLIDRKAQQPGTILLQLQDGSFVGEKPHKFLHELQESIQDVRTMQTSMIHPVSNALTAFIEWLKPATHLVIIGAGNDAIPLATMAHLTGCTTTIVDGRHQYVTKERFPNAESLVLAKPDQVFPQIIVDDHTALVLMTHNYNYELALLRAWGFSEKEPAYMGILGPGKKLRRLLDELDTSGHPISEARMKILHGPVGLDIGAETAEEIALSIMAEIKAVFSQRNGHSLRDRNGSIHPGTQNTVVS